MAVHHKGRMVELQRQWKDRETSPERTKVWTEPKAKVHAERKVPVVYYLSRNGQLEHPHFMEVTLSAADGLYLRDVVNRLNNLRGKGMGGMYSWSSKRSYKNGFVWHDLSENDFIYPVHGHEYVLKGSELLQGVVSPASQDAGSATSAVSSSGSEKSVEDRTKPIREADGDPARRKKTTPWQSFDFNEYKVYKTDSKSDSSAMAADASTQTDDRRQCRRALIRDGRSRGSVPKPEEEISPTTELNRDEISPPPSSSSPETLETLIKADVRATAGGCPAHGTEQAAAAHSGGRLRASAVLMHLISCGSLSVKDHGFSLVSQYRARLPRGREGEALDQAAAAEARGLADRASFPTVNLEDKEYFSGSLIETKKKAVSESAGELAALKRSSSFNADRCSKMGLAEESDGVRAKCIPRRPAKPSFTRRDGGNKGSVSSRSSDGVEKQTTDRRAAS